MKLAFIALVLALCLSLHGGAAELASSPALDIVARYETSFSSPRAPTGMGGGRGTGAPLMGNGDLGVCISGPPGTQTFWIAKNDFWILKKGSQEDRVGASVPNFGTLCVAVPSLAKANYVLRQSLLDAKSVATFTCKDSTVTETSFVAATANLLMVTLECQGKPVEVDVSFQPNSVTRYSHAGNKPLGKFAEERQEGGTNGVRWATRAFTQNVDIATQATVAWKLVGADTPKFMLQPGEPVTVMLAMASNFDARDTLAEALAILDGVDCAAIEAVHKAWWRDFYSRSFVEIPDADIMKRYYLSQYNMACASRNPGFPPCIVGPWVIGELGWCAYWMNYNHAAPYYGLYSSNHIEQADPQDAPLLDFMPVGAQYCKDILGIRGILYPVGLGPLGIDANGTANAGVPFMSEKGVTTHGQRSNAAYNLLNMSQRWYTTYDLDYGRKIYPYARAVADFWEDYLTLENGRYVINDDSALESSGKNKNPGTSLALVRNALKVTIDIGKALNLDLDRHAKWQDILTRLSDYPTCKYGKEHKTVFATAETAITRYGFHRCAPMFVHVNNTLHIQHIYPGGGLGLDSPKALLDIARDTLSTTPRWNDGNGANSFFPAAVRVGYDPTIILAELHQYSTAGMWPNGFSRGNPHGIENCSTVPNTVNEMLMQSHEGVIRLFPVWSCGCGNARFGTLRARGAFLVSAELKGGVVSGVKILSEKGRDCTLQNPWPGEKVKLSRGEILSGVRITFPTKPGEVIELEPSAAGKP